MESKIIPTSMRQPLKMKQPQTGNTNDKNVHARQRRVAPLKYVLEMLQNSSLADKRSVYPVMLDASLGQLIINAAHVTGNLLLLAL